MSPLDRSLRERLLCLAEAVAVGDHVRRASGIPVLSSKHQLWRLNQWQEATFTAHPWQRAVAVSQVLLGLFYEGGSTPLPCALCCCSGAARQRVEGAVIPALQQDTCPRGSPVTGGQYSFVLFTVCCCCAGARQRVEAAVIPALQQDACPRGSPVTGGPYSFVLCTVCCCCAGARQRVKAAVIPALQQDACPRGSPVTGGQYSFVLCTVCCCCANARQRVEAAVIPALQQARAPRGSPVTGGRYSFVLCTVCCCCAGARQRVEAAVIPALQQDACQGSPVTGDSIPLYYALCVVAVPVRGRG